jgi:hypothetical protein
MLMPFNMCAQANMRREGALTLNEPAGDNHGFYSAAIDPANGYAYFGSRYVYKVDITGPLPVQVGAGLALGGGQSYSAAMDPASNCVYFAANKTLYQVQTIGNGALSSESTMPFANYLSQILIDTSDPANHYLYVMTESNGTFSTLYKVALGATLNTSTIVGSASTTAQQPGLGYGAIDPTNHCAYYGTFIPLALPPYVAKFALGSGANGPTNLGGVNLDTATNRSTGNMALDIANGYGYVDSDGNDLLFGHARVYKFALNGTAAPSLVSWVDMHTNEGYCHVTAIRPADGLLYYASDLSYPAFVYRFRLPPGTNAPVETGCMPLLGTSTPVPAWGYNPTFTTNWGEVFARSMVYDPIRDFAYMGRDYADAQPQPYTNQIVKLALDRDEAFVAFTTDGPNTNNTIPYGESFESYTNGSSLVGADGWYGEDEAMGVVETNNYAASYAGSAYPIFGTHQNVLQVDGAVTNRFSPSNYSNVWVDFVMQAKFWTDPIMLTPTNTPFAMCVTTNGHLAVWNCTNPPSIGNGWTELADTSITNGQFFRVTVEADYTRDFNGQFYFRGWVDGSPSSSPKTWYAAACTNQNSFGDLVAQGRFALDDLVVTEPVVAVTGIARHADGTVGLSCKGMNGLPHRVWAESTVSSTSSWQLVSSNVAGADGTWQLTDTNAPGFSSRFYRASLP